MKPRPRSSSKGATKKKRASARKKRAETSSLATVPVTVKNFTRAESHMYFAKMVQEGAFGSLHHHRVPTSIDKQDVIRMNRDTLYSFGVFDLDAAPVKIELPDVGDRFMSLLVIDEDHYNPVPVVYAPGSYTFTRDQIGTRYFCAAIRTLADADSATDVKAANAAQDRIRVQQAARGAFEIPDWDSAARDEVRTSLLALAARAGTTTEQRFGPRDKVDPIQHLLATAAGWGGNPSEAAVYAGSAVKDNDGKTVHRLTVRDVPVDGFWSISIYNAGGFFEKNKLDSYSINNLTAQPNKDGSFTIQLGGCDAKTQNCLVTPRGWNYLVRMYRPRQPVLDGTWQFPEPRPVAAAKR